MKNTKKDSKETASANVKQREGHRCSFCFSSVRFAEPVSDLNPHGLCAFCLGNETRLPGRFSDAIEPDVNEDGRVPRQRQAMQRVVATDEDNTYWERDKRRYYKISPEE